MQKIRLIQGDDTKVEIKTTLADHEVMPGVYRAETKITQPDGGVFTTVSAFEVEILAPLPIKEET